MGLVEKVFVGVGSNLGNRVTAIEQATQLISELPDTELISAASLFETEPVGNENQPKFINSVVQIATKLDPKRFLICLKQIEEALGRMERERWGPREIDLDILVYGERILNEPDLIIPHPEMTRRRFVLVPMAELAPQLIIPGRSKTILDLLHGLEDERGVVPFQRIPRRSLSLSKSPNPNPKQSQNPNPNSSKIPSL